MALINDPEAVRLAKALYEYYTNKKEAKRNKDACDICGRNSGQVNKKYAPKAVVEGFFHRPEQSPSLCWGHNIGWIKTTIHAAQNDVDLTDNNQVDLLFATFLAKHLAKQANLYHKLQ